MCQTHAAEALAQFDGPIPGEVVSTIVPVPGSGKAMAEAGLAHWHGQLPVRVELASHPGLVDSGREEAEGWDLAVGREEPPPPLYLMVPRVGYLEALEEHVRRGFAPAFQGRGGGGGEAAAADGRELGFEADGQPLRWQYPGNTRALPPQHPPGP